ncbi:PIR Superfamily Protein [Plasmodium ovale wallikeri]|uniref:PIR protein n=2 Tax=Plasmodium ovale TaxID=36330 RepID=A0A1C3KFF8_PLAOA|nr:PIR Superfamily Protein [Plasmodium ovale wallikeri]SBT72352.1 PIR protein [Plasmodium ovale]
MGIESYDFFKYFAEYIKYEESIQTQWNTSAYINGCTFDGRINFEKLNDVEVICAKFKYFYNLLFYTDFRNTSKHKEYTEYLNFWVNSQLKNNIIPTTTVNDFYNKLKHYSITFDVQNALQHKIYDINKEEFTNMKFLYDLYRSYYNILIITEASEGKYRCLDHSTKCAQVYEEAIKKCPTNGTVFCKALNVFKGKYDEINKKESLKNCEEQELPSLPEYKAPTTARNEFQDEHLEPMEAALDSSENATITYFNYIFGITGTTLGILFTLLILYKYTPLRFSLFRRIIKGRKTRTNLEEAYNHELLLDNSALEHNNSYNISYDSTLNY